MNSNKSHKTLEYMTNHFINIRLMSPSLFHSALNDLLTLANSEADDDILSNYDPKIHTPGFFQQLLSNLGYDKDGNKLRD